MSTAAQYLTNHDDALFISELRCSELKEIQISGDFEGLSARMSGVSITLALLAISVGLIYRLLKNASQYWEERGVHTVADNVITGGMTDMFLQRATASDTMRRLYEETEGHRYFGTYMLCRPIMVVRDRDIVHEVLLKDFANFPGNAFYINEEKDPLSGTLINLSGTKWKNMRSKLTHVFTTAKLKNMFGTMLDCIDRVHHVFEKKIAASSGKNVDVRDVLGCLGTDIIASVAFGIDVNTVENPDNEFRQMGRRIATPDIFFFIRAMFIVSMHKLAAIFNVKQLDSKTHAFIIDLVKRTVEYREKNNVVRPDFLHLLIQLKNKGYIEGMEGHPDFKSAETSKITLNELTAQVFVFFQAGFETSTLTVSMALYHMCLNTDIKNKAMDEIDQALATSGGKITYDVIQSLVYIDNVVHEALRLHPPIGIMMRQASNDCKLPLTDVELEKGTAVAIPVMGLHMDPKYFPEPEKFDPDRFTNKAKTSRPSFVYLPFGEGPRICIGMRFGLLQVKTVLLALLSRYDFEISEETPYPLTFDPKGIIPFPVKMLFNISKRTDQSC